MSDDLLIVKSIVDELSDEDRAIFEFCYKEFKYLVETNGEIGALAFAKLGIELSQEL